MKGKLDRYEFMSYVDDQFKKCETQEELKKMKEILLKDVAGMFTQNVVAIKMGF